MNCDKCMFIRYHLNNKGEQVWTCWMEKEDENGLPVIHEESPVGRECTCGLR